jgi:ABC-type polysaccharide/polyol phosphate transport system ATPase subunit
MIAIDVSALTKIYKMYQSPTERLKEIMLRKPFHTAFIALKNINFSVMKGETLGIIGENGAGKSTLLKILAKTVKPTSGEIKTNGRTAALLELGTGFNPEFTGEENIDLNAYLMGLTKIEIDKKREEIIAFAELADFIKRPVKIYSSGMQVRLAFSIATSVDPDILIIDEALSVGDEYFQKKCIDRMIGFKKACKTILFCSHSMYHVQELCNRTVWLHKGEVKNIGDTGKIIFEYQNYGREKTGVLKDKSEHSDSAITDEEKIIKITDIRILDKDDRETETIKTFDPISVSFKIRCNEKNLKGHIGFAIIRNDEVMTFGTTTHYDGMSPIYFKDGQECMIKINSLPVLSGLFCFMLIVADEFAVHPFEILRTKTIQVYNESLKEFGMTFISHDWIL